MCYTVYLNQPIRVEMTVYDADTEAVVNISTATLAGGVLSPVQVLTSLTPHLVTDGTDGKLYVDVPADTLDVEGTWLTQARATIAGKTYPATPVIITPVPSIWDLAD